MIRILAIFFLGITVAGAQTAGGRVADPYRTQLSQFVLQHINDLYTDVQSDEGLFIRITARCGGKQATANPEVKKLFLDELNERLNKEIAAVLSRPAEAEKRRFSGKPQVPGI